jgi:hypothetical protein
LVPPLQEQDLILKYITKQTDHLPPIEELARRQIALLRGAIGYAVLFSLKECSLNRRSTRLDRYQHPGQFLRR